MEFRLPAITCKVWINTTEAFFAWQVNFFFWVQGYSSASPREGWMILVFCVLLSHHVFLTAQAALALILLERIWAGWASGHWWKSTTAEPWAGKLPVSYIPCSGFAPLFLAWLKHGLQQVRNLPSHGASTGKVISCVLIHWKIGISIICDRAMGLGFFFPAGVGQWNFQFW